MRSSRAGTSSGSIRRFHVTVVQTKFIRHREMGGRANDSDTASRAIYANSDWQRNQQRSGQLRPAHHQRTRRVFLLLRSPPSQHMQIFTYALFAFHTRIKMPGPHWCDQLLPDGWYTPPCALTIIRSRPRKRKCCHRISSPAAKQGDNTATFTGYDAGRRQVGPQRQAPAAAVYD